MINDAVQILDDQGLIIRIDYKAAPFSFGQIALNTYGKKAYLNMNTKDQELEMKVFISHSSADVEIVKLIIKLIRSSLNLSPNEILCSSIEGHKLSPGVNTDERLKEEVHRAKSFIGVITENSINSSYVLFELGARWGANLPMVPIICDEKGTSILSGPLKNINCLTHIKRGDLYSMIDTISGNLGIESLPTNSFLDEVENILSYNSNIAEELNMILNDESKEIISYEEERWKSDKSRAETIYQGIITLDISKVKNNGTTREIDEILDSYFSKTPEVALKLVELFNYALDDSRGSPEDLENKKLTREFLACYFVTSATSTVRALLLESDFRERLFKSAQEDNNVYVKVQLVKALSNTIDKTNMKACKEFLQKFINNDNVLVSGFTYIFLLECGYVEFKVLQSTWEQAYQDSKHRNLYAYLADKNKRICYIATILAGYVNDQPSLLLLEKNTYHEYDQVRICARSSLARRV